MALSSVNIDRHLDHRHIRICFMNPHPEWKLAAISRDWQAIGVPAHRGSVPG